MVIDELEYFLAHNGTSYQNDLLVTAETSAGDRIGLSTFEHSFAELCAALPLCGSQSDLYVDIVVSLVEEAGVSPPTGGEREIANGYISIEDGVGDFDEEGYEDLGYGHHTVRACIYDDVPEEIGCMEQGIQVDPPLGVGTIVAGGTTGEIAGEIGNTFVTLAGRPGATQLTGLTNDGQVTLALPTGFVFPFYGTNQSTLRVQSNGGLIFGTGSTALASTNQALPHSTAPDIAVLWDDHNPAAGGGVWVYYDAERCIVSWEGVPHASGSASLTTSFQVHLLPSGRIEMHYADTYYGTGAPNGGAGATIGTQRPDDGAYLEVSHNTAIWGTGEAERAVALANQESISSALRFPDWVQCNDPDLDVPEILAVDACERTDGKVWIPSPKIPTLCAWPKSYRVEGWVIRAGTTPQNLEWLPMPQVVEGNSFEAEPGVYEILWYVRNGVLEVSGPYSQIVTVAPSYPVVYGNASSTTYDFTSINSAGTALNLGADDQAAVTLPFSFYFYGGSYTSIWVSANGAIRFDSGSVAASNVAIPTLASTAPDIAVFWDDLNPASAGDAYTYHDSENQRMIVSWEGVPHHPNVGAGSFQMHLYATGRIEFHYSDANFGTAPYDNGGSATIGIQAHVAGQAGPHYKAISYNSAWSTMDGVAKAFQPTCE